MRDQDRIFRSMVAHKNSIQKTEKARKEKPTKSDIKETKKIFEDFGVPISADDIPDFNSAYELEKWRTKRITEYLDR